MGEQFKPVPMEVVSLGTYKYLPTFLMEKPKTEALLSLVEEFMSKPMKVESLPVGFQIEPTQVEKFKTETMRVFLASAPTQVEYVAEMIIADGRLRLRECCFHLQVASHVLSGSLHAGRCHRVPLAAL